MVHASRCNIADLAPNSRPVDALRSGARGVVDSHMRVLACGDRNWSDQALIDQSLDALHAQHRIEVLIEGEARGADTLARIWAESHEVPVMRCPAAWRSFGKAVGVIRNQMMLQEGLPNYCIAFHDDIEHSKGTKDMVRRCRSAGVPTEVVKH